MTKKLYKSADNKILCGVCAGFAEYLDLDPTLVRLGWVLFTFFGGAGIIVYIIAAIIMPQKPQEKQDTQPKPEQN